MEHEKHPRVGPRQPKPREVDALLSKLVELRPSELAPEDLLNLHLTCREARRFAGLLRRVCSFSSIALILFGGWVCFFWWGNRVEGSDSGLQTLCKGWAASCKGSREASQFTRPGLSLRSCRGLHRVILKPRIWVLGFGNNISISLSPSLSGVSGIGLLQVEVQGLRTEDTQ